MKIFLKRKPAVPTAGFFVLTPSPLIAYNGIAYLGKTIQAGTGGA
jgi:hypothetical protein